MQHTHNCIKCSEKYSSKDEEPYYCEVCNTEKMKIAQAIDKKFANRPKEKPMTDLQRYDVISKQKGSRFVNIKDMGISL